MQESFVNSPLIYSIALTLIHFLWQGVLIALALKTALTFTSNQKSQLRYALSTGAMILNLIVPIITFFIIYTPEYLQLSHSFSSSSIAAFQLTKVSQQQGEWYSNIVDFLPYLTMVWLCIVSILSLKLLIELHSVNQLPKKNTVAPDSDLYNRFQALSLKVGITTPPTLLLSLNTHVPMAIGWLKPIVLIPINMLTGLTPTQLDMLMLHELAHIRRHDYVVNFIQSIVEIILFFHPCVLWVSNQMRNEREYCSDDIAVKHCGNPIAYAHTLADTASICNKHRNHSIPNMAMAASGGDLTQRVLRLVNEHHCASSNQISKWFASLAVLSTILFVLSHQLVKQLDIELKAASYTPKITILNSPVESEYLLIPNTLNTLKDTVSTTQAIALSEQPVLMNEIEHAKSIQQTNPAITKNKVITSLSLSSPNNTEKNESIESAVLLPAQGNINRIKTELTYTNSAQVKNISTTPTKSMTELALEQTSSNALPQTLQNKYSEQLAELAQEPVRHKYRTPAKKLSLNNAFEGYQSPYIANSLERRLTPVKTAAELIYSVPPRYPSTAKRKGIELEVKVDFTIDTKGGIKEIKFPSIRPQMNYFKTSVRLALNKWRFIPAEQNGEVVESKMSKIFSFSLYE